MNQFFQMTSVTVGLLFTVPAAHALEATTVNMNNMKLFGCFTMDPATGDPKPNGKDAGCKVVSNIPGEKESVLTLDTTVNVGTFEKPQDRPTRMEIRITKDKGKPVRFEQKITDTTSGRSDVTRYEISAKGELKNGQSVQNETTFAWMDKDRCQALKPLVEAVGAQPLVQCMSVAQGAVEPISKIIDQLAKDKMRLGTASPSSATPSMVEWKPVDTQKMGDVFTVLVSCGQAFALEKAQAEGGSAAATAKKGQATQGVRSPTTPQTKPAPARP